MIITLSCSMKRIDDAVTLADQLRSQGHTVHLPSTSYLPTKRAYIDDHLDRLKKSDSLLLANFPDNQEYGRVGASGFFESGWAYALGKKVYYLNTLDPGSPYTEDIEAVATKFEQNTATGGNNE